MSTKKLERICITVLTILVALLILKLGSLTLEQIKHFKQLEQDRIEMYERLGNIQDALDALQQNIETKGGTH